MHGTIALERGLSMRRSWLLALVLILLLILVFAHHVNTGLFERDEADFWFQIVAIFTALSIEMVVVSVFNLPRLPAPLRVLARVERIRPIMAILNSPFILVIQMIRRLIRHQ
jgi:hypothetical protein